MRALPKHWTHDAIGVCTGIAGLALLIATVAAGGAIGLGVGRRGAEAREAPLSSYGPASVIVPLPHFVDATASDFDAARQPGFAPVTSLTEAQVLRQRAMRDREKRRARLTGVSPTAGAAS